MTATAAVFMSGNSQAVRLPKAFQVKSRRVTIERRGDEIVLREVPPAMKDGPHIGDESPAASVDAR